MIKIYIIKNPEKLISGFFFDKIRVL